VSENLIDMLVQNACFAADSIVLSSVNRNQTSAEMTRRVLQRALEMLIANNLIKITPVEDWPEYVVLDPPYTLPAPYVS
jgi:hypothetical protein